MIFINTPINPTGTIVHKDAFERFLEKIPADVILVMDEAYVEYVTDSSYPDTLKYVSTGKKMVVLRTFSKIYGSRPADRIRHCRPLPYFMLA